GATFSIRKKSNLLDGLLWVANNRFENFLKMVKHTTYRRRLVKISVILQLSAQAHWKLNHSQLPLERISWSHGLQRCNYQLLHLDRLQERNLVEEIKLEYGVATGPTGRHHLVEYGFDRKLIIVEGFEGGGAHSIQDLAEGGVTREGGP